LQLYGWKELQMKALAGLAVLAALTLAVAGCGGDGSGGVASLEGSGQTTTDDTTTTASEDPEEAALAFARCMRKHGIDVPDPGPNGAITVNGRPGMGREKMEQAQKACGGLLQRAGGGQGPSEEQQQAMQEAALEMSRCMREHGIEKFPDPKFDGGGMALMLPRGIDPNTPEFKAAQKACEPIMQKAAQKAGLRGPGGQAGTTSSREDS
jgi:hypothetical protein